MIKRWVWWVGVVMLLASCSIPVTGIQPVASPVEPTAEQKMSLPNLASVYCEEQGYILEIRTDAEGGQYGVCIFPDESECEEWAYYRGECAPAAEQTREAIETGEESTPTAESTAPASMVAYVNDEYGFAFAYPATWTLEEAPQALKLTRGGALIYVAYKAGSEEWRIHWTGMPEGDWVEADQVPCLGQMLQKTLLVFDGKVKVVTYALPEEASSILGLDVRVDDRTGASYAEVEISTELQAEAEQILASFRAI